MTNEDTTREDLRRQCQGLADTLEFIATHEGEEWDDIDPDEIPACVDREDVEGDEGEPLSLLDYCGRALSVEIFGQKVEGEWEYRYCEVVFTTGGPHVEFTTQESSYVEGYWGGDRAKVYVGCDVGARLDEIFAE